ncbi:hypothetical protein GCM10010215_64280 [Streptomyces virginiae]|uniref:Uncharacterized protein n=1 Tax=Streptomyces virginiae TaxID=1961 RepID=A0ABQ3NTE5_STRVG|nr:hypothetical protein GCM10010215_64280 [Streptomyces virginiae]GHI16055.1 hypothetical protein Scinn_55180 [Streptomyces virginiae]GLV95709.1 hypothetical protein Slala04_71620 [Streptomyces lavendulae subsp. lavendulae]
MAWDEWDNAKANVAAQQQASMRLNQLPGASGGGEQADLVVYQDYLGRGRRQ